MKYFTTSAEQTIEIGYLLGQKLQQGDNIALTGALAVGKTHFAKGVAQGLEIVDEITSPTFTIISEYSGRLPLYHFDLYRLSSYDDFLDIGGDEYLSKDGVCLIEWSEKILTYLPKNTITISFILQANNREITITNCPYQMPTF